MTSFVRNDRYNLSSLLVMLWYLVLYAVILAIVSITIARAYPALGIDGWLTEATTPFLALLLLFGVQEGLVRALWWGLQRRYQAGGAELMAMLAQLTGPTQCDTRPGTQAASASNIQH